MESGDTDGTLMEIKNKLDLDQNGTLVDATKYRSMIGALMYLTSSRPDIVHATCLCAQYQAKPTEKHLKEVKRIFHYLRGTINMGLWYTKDSSFKLTGFSDADYAGCNDTFKSTSGGAHFLGKKLTVYQLADLFTKALLVDRFNYLVRRLGMRSLSPQELERLAKSRVCPNLNAPAGRLLGAYDLGIAIPRTVVHADDKTSGDARFLQIYKLTNIIVDVFEYHFQAKEMISRIELHVSRL
ncbi:hypothetical protein Tco_0526036 [Tanacetum coccineum]